LSDGINSANFYAHPPPSSWTEHLPLLGSYHPHATPFGIDSHQPSTSGYPMYDQGTFVAPPQHYMTSTPTAPPGATKQDDSDLAGEAEDDDMVDEDDEEGLIFKIDDNTNILSIAVREVSHSSH
uniref:Deformed n=1 Tax=Anisakis simplex TaxID=6269 RepID=A0A0M3KCI6_ANISI